MNYVAVMRDTRKNFKSVAETVTICWAAKVHKTRHDVFWGVSQKIKEQKGKTSLSRMAKSRDFQKCVQCPGPSLLCSRWSQLWCFQSYLFSRFFFVLNAFFLHVSIMFLCILQCVRFFQCDIYTTNLVCFNEGEMSTLASGGDASFEEVWCTRGAVGPGRTKTCSTCISRSLDFLSIFLSLHGFFLCLQGVLFWWFKSILLFSRRFLFAMFSFQWLFALFFSDFSSVLFDICVVSRLSCSSVVAFPVFSRYHISCVLSWLRLSCLFFAAFLLFFFCCVSSVLHWWCVRWAHLWCVRWALFFCFCWFHLLCFRWSWFVLFLGLSMFNVSIDSWFSMCFSCCHFLCFFVVFVALFFNGLAFPISLSYCVFFQCFQGVPFYVFKVFFAFFDLFPFFIFRMLLFCVFRRSPILFSCLQVFFGAVKVFFVVLDWLWMVERCICSWDIGDMVELEFGIIFTKFSTSKAWRNWKPMFFADCRNERQHWTTRQRHISPFVPETLHWSRGSE